LTADRWHLILRLYHRALGREGETRVAFLDTECAGDDALRRQVESLLAEDPPENFLAAPALDAMTEMTGAAPDPALECGRLIGTYCVASRLGIGGMGDVYLARDMNLHRDVALKVLPRSFVLHPDRLARFKREALVLASLSHSNIAAIYGFEESESIQALVLELIDGDTLAESIARGPIPLDQALPIAKQIVDALEAAHEKGVIHRDLKPANIKVRPDGTVKVLDFGLAKLAQPEASAPTDAVMSPAMATEVGMILGTPAYMAPEQARGKAVDTRADIWAFGCVLFEMLAGVRPFKGDTFTDTIAAIVAQEPDWQALPAAASAVRPLLARCLTKDPRQRLQAIGEARIQIEALIGGASQAALPLRPRPVLAFRANALAAVAVLAGGGLIGAALVWALVWSAPQPGMPSARFELVAPPSLSLASQRLDRDIAISPDGQYVVYRAGDGPAQLVVRALDDLETRPLAGTANARYPFFSPDSRWIGFFDGAILKKVFVTGGTVVTISRSPSPVSRGASWADDNSIVFASQDTTRGLLQVPAAGGEPTVLTTPEPAKGELDHWFPSVLPGGRGVLFTIRTSGAEPSQVAVLDLQTGRQRTLVRGSQAEYLETGHLLFLAAGALHAVRFDLGSLQVLSDPAPVVEAMQTFPGTGAGNYAISRQGTLVYVPADAGRTRSLVWIDRTGRQTPLRAPPRMYTDLRLSPDARHVALGIRDQEDDVWIWDLERAGLTRLTTGPALDSKPVWTADGQYIVFGSRREGGQNNLFAQAANGTGIVERLTSGPNYQAAYFVAPDGMSVLGYEVAATTGADIVRFPLSAPVGRSAPGSPSGSATRTVEPLARTPFREWNLAISPDMRYLAYQSNESGVDEIYVRPFPGVDGGRWQVSMGGGTLPVWSRDRRELYYLDATNTLMAVPVQPSGTTFAWGEPVELFKASYALFDGSERSYDVSPDGQRFLMIKEHVADGQDAVPPPLVVALNWHEELKRLVPTN
jgi:eukaryotic-like serine/threonine-protein kinase